MRGLVVVTVLSFLGSGSIGCQRSAEDKAAAAVSTTGSAAAPTSATPQVKPPVDLKHPPKEAIKTPSGLIYLTLTKNPSAPAPQRNDTVLINYTGWKQESGETFFSNRDRGQPMPLPLYNTARGFTEAMQLVHKGERTILWMPPEIGTKGAPVAKPETLVYEVEIIDIVPAPQIPDNVATPPETAPTLPSGTKIVTVRNGTGKDKARYFDTLTFNYSAWDATGRMFDSTEVRKRPATVAPYRQTAVMEEVLTSMTAGQRVRFWVPAEKMQAAGRGMPGMPTGLLCYEVELIEIAKGNAPPAPPPDVAKPPAGTKTTPAGVAYRILAHGKGGPHPGPKDTVRVNYTGWTTDGRMFDSSAIKGEPGTFKLDSVIEGWTDAIPLLAVGDKARFWVPAEKAYKGALNKPQGMLVYDVELVEVRPAGEAKPIEGGATDLPAPPDVAAAPADAKRTPKGVAYKVLAPGSGDKHPSATDRVSVNYTGWTTDGKQFDSSFKRGKPAEFSLSAVIEGWTDALQLMTPGEKVRLWIPEELAYKGQPGKPAGMLVFDVELLEIK